MSETTLRLDRPLKMVTICLGQMQTNCYIVENTKTNQAFVFDPGDQGERIMNTLEEDGMELAGVCLTHGHFDHVMALPYLMEQKPDLDIYLYEDEAEVLADPQLNLGAMMGMNLSLKANHLVKDGEIIDVLGTKVKCIHVPGHTKGGVCYYFADYGWLISGDTLFQMSIGRTDFPTGNLNDLLTAIREKLFVLPPWTKVLSGHTPPTTIEEESRCNPFLQQIMIGLIQNKTIYEYDIRSLILAFMLGEKIELTDHVDSIYDFILDVDYKDQEIAMNLYKKGELEDEIQLFGDYENKKIFKNQMKRGIYQLFSKALDKQLPWGTLTGIRPTKIAFDGYEKGESSEEIIHRFQKDYLASEEKARLCTETVKKEKELLKAFPYKEGYSLYIGIPFCPSTCLYCSFTSYSIDQFENIVQDYLEALLKELDFVAKTYANKEHQTMYIGGGTPTSLKEEDLEYLLCEVNKRFPFSKIQEITVEAGRPDSLNLEKLKILKKYGVTRISINPQSMNDKTLKLIGRNHFSEDIKEKFNLARQAGIDNINMDMICGLPEEGMEELSYTLAEIKKLDPESLTVHALAVKRSSRLNRMKDTYHFGASEEMVSYAASCARDMDMEPYYLYRQKNIPGNLENVGFSKKGKECLYNILIMEELHDIIAVGAGTSSKIVHQEDHQVDRIENLKDIKQYITRIDEIIHRKELKMI